VIDRKKIAAALFAAALQACGQVQSPTLLGPAAGAQSAFATASAPLTRSWILPRARKGPLLYVTSLWTSAVYILSYPGLRLVGALAGSDFDQPVGICSDDAGNVFVPLIDEATILEYAHGGTAPIATLNSSPGVAPYTCAVDSSTGNLAVTVQIGSAEYAAVYAKERGTPKTYQDSYLVNPVFCGYDDRGNLFADGYNTGRTDAALTELPKGGTAFATVPIDTAVRSPGSVQWDGKHITIFDSGNGVLYRLRITSSGAQVIGSTQLNPYGNGIYGTWIQGYKIIGANDARAFVGIWNYPAGGDVTKMVAVEEPFAVTISNVHRHDFIGR
jgi:hypothetical protein